MPSPPRWPAQLVVLQPQVAGWGPPHLAPSPSPPGTPGRASTTEMSPQAPAGVTDGRLGYGLGREGHPLCHSRMLCPGCPWAPGLRASEPTWHLGDARLCPLWLPGLPGRALSVLTHAASPCRSDRRGRDEGRGAMDAPCMRGMQPLASAHHVARHVTAPLCCSLELSQAEAMAGRVTGDRRSQG